MKRPGIILCLTLSNLALLAVVTWQVGSPKGQPPDSTGSALARRPGDPGFFSRSSSSSRHDSAGPEQSGLFAAAGTASQPVSQPPDPAPANATPAKLPTFDWRQVESEDYRTYIRNLHAIGCPDQTVQDIVAADVRQSFAARRAELMGERYHDFKFWKSDVEESAVREDFEPRRRAVDDEMAAVARELLGTDTALPPSTTDWQQAAWTHQLQFLPADKREATQALLLRYADVDAQIRSLAWGHGTPENPEERRRVLAAYEQKRAGLQALLSPEEYELVDLTVSWTADNLRRAMTKFRPTEEEFRLIFREWRAQDENLARLFGTGRPDPGKEHVFAKIETLLSPDRYQLYRETWWK
jgi:hypothetical protein